MVITIFYAGYLAGNLFSALVGDLIRAKTLIVGGMVVCIGSILITTLSPYFWLTVVGLAFMTGSIILPYNMTYIFITEMV